jgi:hypothetical protein
MNPGRIIVLFVFFAFAASAQTGKGESVEFTCSDPVLQAGFLWAKQQAMTYVRRDGDPVGDWYEAALPGRDAFCMRDVSHQLIGANVLGLQDINKNLLTKFVKSIALSRDWCGYWEIDKLDRPAPVDYQSDRDFWYNLPANFDILDACYRQYLWTGDTTYLHNPVFLEYYRRTCNEYVSRWDKDADGIMEGTRSKDFHYRGIGSYNEDQHGITGSDLIAAQALGYRSYSAILALTGADRKPYDEKSKRLFSEFNDRWWDERNSTYFQFLKEDGKWVNNDPMQLFLLRWDFIPPERAKKFLATLSRQEELIWVEAFSYYPREVFRYGDPGNGCRLLRKLTSPDLKRREYPEVSFSTLEAYVEGLMGIGADAAHNQVSTISRLPGAADWAHIKRLPVLDGTIDVKHEGTRATVFVNHTQKSVYWKASFYSDRPGVAVNGKRQPAKILRDMSGRTFVTVLTKVMPGAASSIEH